MGENDIVVRPETRIDNPPIADDFLLQVADQAEKRIDAVLKIKRIAIKVTNAGDWCEQNGKPYMMVSASEKIANLFNISWRIDEPRCEDEDDGHYTFTYRGTFTLAGRSIDAEGSRSSKDGFFKQYAYPEDEHGKAQKTEKGVGDRDNKRDVRMAAYTNLLGNGITRILGMRNMTFADLLEYAGIRREDIGKVEYKGKSKPAINMPTTPASETPPAETTPTRQPRETDDQFATGIIEEVKISEGVNKTTKKPWTKYGIVVGGNTYGTFDEKIGKLADELKGKTVVVTWAQNGKFKNCLELSLAQESKETVPPEPTTEDGIAELEKQVKDSVFFDCCRKAGIKVDEGEDWIQAPISKQITLRSLLAAKVAFQDGKQK